MRLQRFCDTAPQESGNYAAFVIDSDIVWVSLQSVETRAFRLLVHIALLEMVGT